MFMLATKPFSTRDLKKPTNKKTQEIMVMALNFNPGEITARSPQYFFSGSQFSLLRTHRNAAAKSEGKPPVMFVPGWNDSKTLLRGFNPPCAPVRNDGPRHALENQKETVKDRKEVPNAMVARGSIRHDQRGDP